MSNPFNPVMPLIMEAMEPKLSALKKIQLMPISASVRMRLNASLIFDACS